MTSQYIKNFIAPLILGFTLTASAGVIGNYLLTRDLVNDNKIRIKSLEDYKNSTSNYGDRILTMEQRQNQDRELYKTTQKLIEKQGNTLDRIDSTLTTIAAGYGAELNNIKHRMEKAGI